MDAKKVNEILIGLFKKDTTTSEEKKALLIASDCVWKAKSSKVIDESTFKQMLYDHMGYDYDVEIKKTDTETEILVKTFKNKY